MYNIKLSPYSKIFYHEWKLNPHSYKYNIKQELHNQAQGLYPVYSANIHTAFGWVNNLLQMDFANDFVLWGIDGDWMTRCIPQNTAFVPTDHCGFLECFNKNIELEYTSYMLYIQEQN